MVHRKYEKRQSIIRQRTEPILRKPDRVGQTDNDKLIAIDKRQRAKDRITQTRRRSLHRVAERRWSNLTAEVFEDVRLARRDYETNLGRAALDHPFDQVFADRTRAFIPILDAAAHGQQLFGKREWLNAAAN